jgi:hypothetical protein
VNAHTVAHAPYVDSKSVVLGLNEIPAWRVTRWKMPRMAVLLPMNVADASTSNGVTRA